MERKPMPGSDLLPPDDHQGLLETYSSGWDHPILPSSSTLASSRSSLPDKLPSSGFGPRDTANHLFRNIASALNGNSLSSRYYGFVTGGATPIAHLADNIVSCYDQNVQVHLPRDTITTDVEAKALDWLQDMLGFDRGEFQARTFTTGATASNILGLACGREFIMNAALRAKGKSTISVSQDGILAACVAANISSIQILTTLPHSSLSKAAAVLGLGRDSVQDIRAKDDPLKIDLSLLKSEARKPSTATILAISCGEVNTGRFATTEDEMHSIRRICNELNIWIHVDGAFGIYGRILDHDNADYPSITDGCAGMELADSITGDCHKFLNVPYDCGFFFCRSPEIAESVFKNPNAAYLAAARGSIPSPLNIGIENSRRFRALPVYATLHAYGVDGYRRVLEAQIRLARCIVTFLNDHRDYEVLPTAQSTVEAIKKTFVIVLFRAKNEPLNEMLVEKINYGEEGEGKIYVSGTAWEGKKAARIAVSNWAVDWEKDFEIVKEVLERVAQSKV